MTNQLNAAFEVIAIDSSRAYFLDNTDGDQPNVFEEFENHAGVSLKGLEQAARMKTTVFVPADDRHYTVGRTQTVGELKADKPFAAQLG
nr:hypothetical protein [uncultured Shimia sp.]